MEVAADGKKIISTGFREEEENEISSLSIHSSEH